MKFWKYSIHYKMKICFGNYWKHYFPQEEENRKQKINGKTKNLLKIFIIKYLDKDIKWNMKMGEVDQIISKRYS